MKHTSAVNLDHVRTVDRSRLDWEAETRRTPDAEAAKWLQVVDDNLSPAGIERNLESLQHRGSGSRTAAAWLVNAGDRILPFAHPKLLDPASSDELTFSLVQVVGEIGDPSSIAPVIEVIRRDPDVLDLLKAGLYALAVMPPSDDSRDLVGELLGEDHSMAARQLIRSDQPRDRQGAAAFLVEGGHAGVLGSTLRLDLYPGLPLLAVSVHSPTSVQVLAQIRRTGYRIEETPVSFELVRDE